LHGWTAMEGLGLDIDEVWNLCDAILKEDEVLRGYYSGEEEGKKFTTTFSEQVTTKNSMSLSWLILNLIDENEFLSEGEWAILGKFLTKHKDVMMANMDKIKEMVKVAVSSILLNWSASVTEYPLNDSTAVTWDDFLF